MALFTLRGEYARTYMTHMDGSITIQFPDGKESETYQDLCQQMAVQLRNIKKVREEQEAAALPPSVSTTDPGLQLTLDSQSQPNINNPNNGE